MNRLLVAGVALALALPTACTTSPPRPNAEVSRAVTEAVDASLPYNFVVRADIVAEEAGTIRCASRVIGTDPTSARQIADVAHAYLVAVCIGRTEQAVVQHVPPVCLVAPVSASVLGRTRLPPTAFTVIDSAGDRLRADVRMHFPPALRHDALRTSALTGPLWRRLGQDPAHCGR